MQQFLVRGGSDLGAAVAESRLIRGLTQEQLSEETGIERTYLARLEAGASVQLLDRALFLLRRLGAEVTVTLPEEPAPTTKA
ncbi:helix-turn-helix domain-containing protein [Kineosporia babensis]|uniref:Helix-turn-helix domain-containing protein n=1 Tax=Kineosporia babensis TaxID=499548 RepID=A0A9X1NEU9_9ACTN|nr:helix-turn-helix transcriptional regulator [Kineosporia babensis]MCD5312394.1 helix-turn-helix domain-containing protein [Kineosporia babensis]